MTKPILLAVDNNILNGECVQRELRKRYAADYEVICAQSPEAALRQLEALKVADAQVLMLLAAREMASITGVEFLAQARVLYPHAKRVLLLPPGNRSESIPL